MKMLNRIKNKLKLTGRYFLVLTLLISSIPFLVSSAASAETCDTVYYAQNDILFYNPCETCQTDGSKLLGASNEEKVFKWLKGRGFNSAQAAGMMGNMWTESSFNPFRMQTTYSSTGLSAVLPIADHKEYNKAFGLVQWDGGRRQAVLTQIEDKFPDYVNDINTYGKSADGYKDAAEKNEQYLAFELEFMFQELSNGYKHVFDEIKAQPDSEAGVAASAEIWNRKYEVSGDYSQDRHNKGKEYYSQFKDAVAPVSAGGECSSGEPAGELVYYSQTDTRWKSIGYAGGTIGELGCGPTSMAMILATLIDKNITPTDVASAAGVQNGLTDHAELIRGVNEKWNLDISTTSISFDAAVEFVKSGKGYVWVGGGGPTKTGQAPFTKAGHMVAMVGVASDGRITIADPYGDGPGHQRISNYDTALIASEGTAYYGVNKK